MSPRLRPHRRATWEVTVPASDQARRDVTARGFRVCWQDAEEMAVAVDAPSEDALAGLVAPHAILRARRVGGGWAGDEFHPAPELEAEAPKRAEKLPFGMPRRTRRTEKSLEAAVAARDAVAEYLAAHRDTYGGSWFEWRGDQARMTLGFTRDVERHRAHLAPAVDVVACAHSFRELEELQGPAWEFVEAQPEVAPCWGAIAPHRNALVIDVAAKPGPAARGAAAVRERFGDAVRIEVIAEQPTFDVPAPFHHYGVDATGHVLTVYWNSRGGRGLPLQVVEADDHVAVRITERVRRDVIVVGPVGRRASAPLSRPLGDRAVIDASMGEPRPRA
jgi:hypothetical protein